MKTLLVVHHTPSPYMQEMFEAVLSGATDPEIDAKRVALMGHSRNGKTSPSAVTNPVSVKRGIEFGSGAPRAVPIPASRASSSGAALR